MTSFYILEVHISVALEILVNAFWGEKEVSVKKDEDHYRLNLTVDWKDIWAISINWRGVDETQYYKPMLDLVVEYFDKQLT